MGFHFAEPWWLALMICVPVLAWIGWRWFGAMGRARRLSALVLRSVLVVLLASLLAGASAVRQTDRLAVIAVVDVSGSVQRFAAGPDGGAIERVRGWLAEATADRGPDDLLGVVLFDRRAAAAAAPTAGDVLDRSFSLDPAEGTDIARAIRYAASLVPPDAAGRLVLFSDGNATAGDAREAARSLATAGGVRLPIDVVPIDYRVEREVLIERVDAPPVASAESTVSVRVTLRATERSTGVLRLFREGEEIDINGEAPGLGDRIVVEPGISTAVRDVELPDGRLHQFEAVFEPDAAPGGGTEGGFVGDTFATNNRGESFTLTPGKGSVLLVDGVSDGSETGSGATLARALRDDGIEVELIAPAEMPENLLALQAYDLVILENVPAEALTRQAHESLARHVEDLGGGLVMVGGTDSFGAGGWKGTAVEPILPVKLDLPERAVTPEAAVVLLIDSSGSMSTTTGGLRSKQQIANEAAALAITTLDRRDLIGVVAFAGGTTVVVDLQPNTDAQQIASRTLSIASGGGTNIAAALAQGRSMLRDAEAKLKHVILLTDGRGSSPELLPQLAEQMNAEGITISTIGIGDDVDAEGLAEIAQRGGGDFFRVVNPNTLPRVFVRAIRIVRQPLIRLGEFAPVVPPSGSPLLLGVGSPPTLDGLVLTQRRDEPTVTTAMLHPNGEPLLAHWQRGLGQVVAFTSDAHGEWSSRWIAWPGYRRMWVNIARLASRPANPNRYDLQTEISGDRMTVRVEVADDEGEPIDLLTVPATIYEPDGSTREIQLAQTGPGVYEAQTSVTNEGTHLVVLEPRAGTTPLAPAIGGASAPSGAEYRRLASDPEELAVLAEFTGGRVLDLAAPGAADLFDRSLLEPRRAMTPLWKSLLLLTLIVMMLDIGTRRIAWDRVIGKEFGGGFRQAARDMVANRSQSAARSLESLKSSTSAKKKPRVVAGSAAPAERPRTPTQPTQSVQPPRSTQSPKAEAPQPPRAKVVKPEPAEDDGGGLLAAKRRAQRRYGTGGEDKP